LRGLTGENGVSSLSNGVRGFSAEDFLRPNSFQGGLGTMLWPERALVFDDRDEVINAT
jgi:hypothetical protein